MGKISNAGLRWLRFADDRYKSKILKTPKNVSKQLSFESLSRADFKFTIIFDLELSIHDISIILSPIYSNYMVLLL